jgi:acyl-coenzyme A thioesterase PaaI-like protein
MGTTAHISDAMPEGYVDSIGRLMAEQSALSDDNVIPDNWLNDYTDYQRCFICGQQNHAGLRVRYRQEGERIVTEFTGDELHMGYPGVVHGGLISALLDETMGRTALFGRAWVMTGKLEVRYRLPAPVGEALEISAWATRRRRDSVEARGEVRRPTGELVADGRGLFLRVPDELREQAARQHPEMAAFFRTEAEWRGE